MTMNTDTIITLLASAYLTVSIFAIMAYGNGGELYVFGRRVDDGYAKRATVALILGIFWPIALVQTAWQWWRDRT